MIFTNATHRRYNILTGEWVLVSSHRTERPWQGKEEALPAEQLPAYDPDCYLCPGNTRNKGQRNAEYKNTFVFDNDFPALLPDTPLNHYNKKDLLIAKTERGICRVVCFSPYHNLTLAKMDIAAIEKVIRVWIDQYKKLGSNEKINYVQIFENKGQVMGCSNPHPHCQIWANQTIPNYPHIEGIKQKQYWQQKQSCMLCDYLSLELEQKQRIIFQNDSFIALVPFWAVWPFEVMVIAQKHLASLAQLNQKTRIDLADCIRRLTIRYDNLFRVDFPYSMGIHQAPTDNENHEHWHFHMHYYPPLLRSATVKKFMVGYEMLAMPQRDITPELSTQKLRDLPEKHFTIMQ
jgi:UDPglucose--hexose-1-phosphate uridylyltransferase